MIVYEHLQPHSCRKQTLIRSLLLGLCLQFNSLSLSLINARFISQGVKLISANKYIIKVYFVSANKYIIKVYFDAQPNNIYYI